MNIQSTPDAHMAFRLMRYAMAMQQHLDAGHSIFRWWCRCCLSRC
ncbi:Rpn family recombination-promoting nuclease/putative transposase [Salmonella enterica subsp. enterica]|nr:Rpn family recombination-promoting nuclease/putative transposase [Salmonella enterica subsp. enterica]